MRPAKDASAGRSATPIYDELYSEWRRSFKALPGDRSGEEDLGFTAFGTGPYGHGAHPPHTGHSTPPGPWYPDGRQHHQGHRPQAALPPVPRREH
ncbi:hypothetical protein ACFQVC_22400 [Streptomyces monticola]|uniref:Uncharacterized protein n=1 Tax=Streptomyces monticola TaxID=2666263 RepID=A0ABW2JLG7_9ACTN